MNIESERRTAFAHTADTVALIMVVLVLVSIAFHDPWTALAAALGAMGWGHVGSGA